ncbi:hypothetical protein G9A89_002216 [Geosiphon pyriformis]|nr:hypothetical protein G9A89_002216 [Geosiphon pyriformis]
MSLHHPSQSFQIFQIFGATAYLHKTIYCAGLLRAAVVAASSSLNTNHEASKKPLKLFYLKPVQTGYPTDFNMRLVENIVQKFKGQLNTTTLFTSQNRPSNDEEALLTTKKFLSECHRNLEGGEGKLFIETTGGVNTPFLTGTLQCDFYRPLRLPAILICDGKDGGVSTTISAFESLSLRGYDVVLILMFKHPEFSTHTFLKNYFPKHFRDKRIFIAALPHPPLYTQSREGDLTPLVQYFEETHSDFINILQHLDNWHHMRFKYFREMEQLTRDKFWWSFTQNQRLPQITVVDSTHRDLITTFEGDQNISKEDRTGETVKDNTINGKNQEKMLEIFDGSAGMGHGPLKLALEASYAASRYGHAMLPGFTHEPALQLAENLLKTVGKDWASRVFYSENGGAALEVAIMMALKSAAKRYNQNDKKLELKVLGIKRMYHRDTIDTMDVWNPNHYNKHLTGCNVKGFWFEPPTFLLKNGCYQLSIPDNYGIREKNKFIMLASIFNKKRTFDSIIGKAYQRHIDDTLKSLIDQGHEFGALLIEPVIMGAGGMKFVDPLFQKILIDKVRSGLDFPIPVVFDEVFTGFWRLGFQSGAELLDRKPDVAAYAKSFIGGLLPMGMALTTNSIFEDSCISEQTDTSLHKSSYIANPISCWVANISINEYAQMNQLVQLGGSFTWDLAKKQWQNVHSHEGPIGAIESISHLPNVKGVVTLGTLLAITLEDPTSKSETLEYFSHHSLWSPKFNHILINSLDYANSQKIVEILLSSTSSEDPNFGVFVRSLGNLVYVIASHHSKRQYLREIEKRLVKCLQRDF